MIQIVTKKLNLTDAMRDAAAEQFSFLDAKMGGTLRLTVERLNAHTFKLKVFYQEPHQPHGKIEVVSSDYYAGIDECAKKLKFQLHKLKNKRQRFNERLSLSEVLPTSPYPSIQEEPTEEMISSELTVPVYAMTIEEAVDQINLFQYNVMLFQTNETSTIHALVRQSDGTLKHYTGLTV